MGIKRFFGALFGLVLLAAVIIACIVSTHTLSTMQAEHAAVPMPTPIYGEQGLPYGMQLDADPYLVEDGYAFFDDRTVPLYKRDNEMLLAYADTTARFLASLPEGVRRYMMIVPTRATFEESLSSYTDDENAAINDISALMPDDVICIDLIKALAPHKSEYIYFLTDKSWTAPAARYAALAYADSSDLELPPLDDYYYANLTSDYSGLLREVNGHTIDRSLHDHIAFYTPIYGNNLQTVMLRRSSDLYEAHVSPAVSLSRRNISIYIASRFSHSILQGDANNGKTLIIFGDNVAKLFAPWLTPCYENVILINSKWYHDGVDGLRKIFEEYNVTDFICMQSIFSYSGDISIWKTDNLILD
ncbi:MAG: DHHW family protein [Clostridia bacterium]